MIEVLILVMEVVTGQGMSKPLGCAGIACILPWVFFHGYICMLKFMQLSSYDV